MQGTLRLLFSPGQIVCNAVFCDQDTPSALHLAFQSWMNVIAMIFSTIAMTTLLLLSKFGIIDLAWSWLIVIGTATTFFTALLLGFLPGIIEGKS